MLHQLKETRHGSPGGLSEDYVNEDGILFNDTYHEEWDKILDEMFFVKWMKRTAKRRILLVKR